MCKSLGLNVVYILLHIDMDYPLAGLFNGIEHFVIISEQPYFRPSNERKVIDEAAEDDCLEDSLHLSPGSNLQ